MTSTRQLASLYKTAHNIMRNVDGLQPQEAFDELLKYLFFKQRHESQAKSQKNLNTNEIRDLFATYLGSANSWSSEIWHERAIYLSDECLSDIHNLLGVIEFSKIDLDVRSHALREFLAPDLRRGLGIYLTPEEVVNAVVRFVRPTASQRILDPACGSGTFLIEAARSIESNRRTSVYGIEKNPRMLLLSDLNLNDHPKVKFIKALADSLKSDPHNASFDLILTNPPFGVTLDARDYAACEYDTFKDKTGYWLKKQTSEIVFIERCMQKLASGGTLAIVVPRSVATNDRLKQARSTLGRYGYIYGIMNLPPETFSAAGTQTATIVIFARKYISDSERHENFKLAFANIKNVGFDATGRARQGSDLLSFPEHMERAIKLGKKSDYVRVIPISKKETTFQQLDNLVLQSTRQTKGPQLADLCEYIGTGKTPPRNRYANTGGFLVKVGNLTGTGISWEARDRNFVTLEEMKRRAASRKPLILKEGDILLTSSAHNSIYIAKKSDVYCGIPDFMAGNEVSFVGEIMLIRPDQRKVSPFALLAFLREEATVQEIQAMVRGQTAHLNASDLASLKVPRDVLSNKGKYATVAELLKRQVKLSEQLNSILAEQNVILNGAC